MDRRPIKGASRAHIFCAVLYVKCAGVEPAPVPGEFAPTDVVGGSAGTVGVAAVSGRALPSDVLSRISFAFGVGLQFQLEAIFICC